MKAILGWLAILAAPALATEPGALMLPASQLDWQREGGPPFAQAWADADGSHGRFFRFPPEFASPLHIHTHDYHGVVIEGVLQNPMGDAAAAVSLPAGSAYFVPGGALHRTLCVSETPCLFYVHQQAPFDLIVREPAD